MVPVWGLNQFKLKLKLNRTRYFRLSTYIKCSKWYMQSCKVGIDGNRWRLKNGRIFWTVPKGGWGGGHFQSENYVADFEPLKRAFGMKFKKKRNMIFRKWGGKGKFSEHSSILEAPPVPKECYHSLIITVSTGAPINWRESGDLRCCLTAGEETSFDWATKKLGNLTCRSCRTADGTGRMANWSDPGRSHHVRANQSQSRGS